MKQKGKKGESSYKILSSRGGKRGQISTKKKKKKTNNDFIKM